MDVGVQMYGLILEMFVIIGILFLSIIPHELAHILVLRCYGVPTHLEVKCDADNRLGSYSLSVVANDESTTDKLTRKNIGIVAASGGIAGTIFFIICFLALSPVLTFGGKFFLLFFMGHSIFYTIQETKHNLNLNKGD